MTEEDLWNMSKENIRRRIREVDKANWCKCLGGYTRQETDDDWMDSFKKGISWRGYDTGKPCWVIPKYYLKGILRTSSTRGVPRVGVTRYDEAMDVYDSIIRQDETNSTARKRKVAVLLAQGRVPDAIKELTEYLKKFMSDSEAWQELSDLYLKEGDYSKAGFCIEELILTNPHNHLFYTRYAEIKYTQGGSENLELSKSYFAQACKLNSSSLRALYGLFLSCTAVAGSAKCTAQKKKECQRLATWALKEIAEQYSKCRTTEYDGTKVLETFGSLSLTEKAS
ncbi:unnamed protein product, partial [Meganyctiphanes norvegica]